MQGSPILHHFVHQGRLTPNRWAHPDCCLRQKGRDRQGGGSGCRGEGCRRPGIRYQPKRGHALLFYSMRADGELEELSMHGGCPVLSDTDAKWGANLWIWSKPRLDPPGSLERQVAEAREELWSPVCVCAPPFRLGFCLCCACSCHEISMYVSHTCAAHNERNEG